MIYDRSGYESTFALSAAALCASALVAAMGWRAAPPGGVGAPASIGQNVRP